MSCTAACPTFLGVGAARSGTTSLYQWLGNHPAVFMSPVKETSYFAALQPRFCGPGDDQNLNRPLERNLDGSFAARQAAIVTSWDQYYELFHGSEEYQCRGEISPSYLYYPQAAARIKEKLPNSKVVVLLRDPVERAFSQYKVFAMLGREVQGFGKALELEDSRLKKGWEYGWAYKGLGLYATQLSRYLDIFPQEQIGVWLYEDLITDTSSVLSQICAFLGIDPIVAPDLPRNNTSGQEIDKLDWYYSRYHHIIARVISKIPAPARARLRETLIHTLGPKELALRPETRRSLLESYRPMIHSLDRMFPNLEVTRWVEREEKVLADAL